MEWGGRGGPLFSNQRATEIKEEEEEEEVERRPRFLMESGGWTHGGARAAVCVGFLNE